MSSYTLFFIEGYYRTIYGEKYDSIRYDHLTEILNKILAERPKNAVDIFEQYSRQLKEERFRSKTDHLRDVYVPQTQFEDAKKLIELFQVLEMTRIWGKKKLLDACLFPYFMR